MTKLNDVVLVTGASGFLGGALCKVLLGKKNIRAAVRKVSSTKRIANTEEVIGELSDRFDWSGALSGAISVVHCAARVHVMRETSEDPLKEFRAINVDGTMNLARHAVEAGVRRFIFISSIGVNGGETSGRPFSPFDVPAPHTPYAVSKCEAEMQLLALAEETGLEVVIIRPPLIYGPEAPGNFASLMKALESGIPLPLASIVKNRRSYAYVDNVIDLVVTCLDHPAAANQTFLVSDDEDMSTAALLWRMAAALGKPARLIPVPAGLIKIGAKLIGQSGIAQRLCGSLQVDISKTKALLCWTPPISVDEGLRRTAKHWLKSHQASAG